MKIPAIPALLALVLSSGGAAAGSPIREATGVLHQLDLERNQLVISGHLYRFEDDLVVTVRGGPASVSMLPVGGKVEVEFMRVQSVRILVRIDQLPDNYELEES